MVEKEKETVSQLKTKALPEADDKAMKAAFIAKNGITKCPPAGKAVPPVAAKQTPVAPPPPAPPLVVPERKVMPPRDLGAKPVLMWVPTTELHINDVYQRGVSTGRGKKIINLIIDDFQWHLFQPVTITQREESGYWVIDGQHRMKAAQQIGIREIPAVLLDNLTPAQQALAFAGINGKRVAVNAYAIHYAMVAAADPLSLRLSGICEKVGVVIPRTKMGHNLKPNETMAIGALKAAMKAFGDDALIWTLRLLRDVYPDEPGTITAHAVRLLSGFYATYADFPIHDDTMQAVLLETDPEQIREEAVTKAVSTGRFPWMIAALASAYNAALPAGKTALPCTL